MKIKVVPSLLFAAVIVLCGLIIVFFTWSQLGSWLKYDTFQITSSGPTIEKLERLNHVVTHRVTIADVLTASENNYKGSWIVKGDALLSVDMGKAEIKNKDSQLRTATIILPQPRVIQPRVDHERTTVWSIEKGDGISYWRASVGFGDSGSLRNNAMKKAQQFIEEAARSGEHIKESRERTALLLHNVYSEVGWDIAIEWRKE